jgi:subtilase family serine protease
MVTVAAGISAASLPGAVAFGTTPANTPETVSFILNERNATQLEQSVEQGVSSFDTVQQFAQNYGQSQYAISQLTSYLAKFSITSQVYADNIDVVANGTAGEFDQALAIQQNQYHVPKFDGDAGMHGVPAQSVHGATSAPELPFGIAQYVLAILGLSNYSPFTSQAVHTNATLTKPNGATGSACEALSGLPDACNLPSDFASNYGLNKIEKSGSIGAGETLGIVTLAALDPGAPQYFWKNIANVPTTGRTVTIDNVDGGPGAPSDAAGTGETDLDVEQSGGVAPGANVIVYQAPNTDSGFADAFFSAASDNVASSVSASWGESETYVQAAVASGVETPAYEASFDEAFLEMAVQGQSGFVSAGDSGAYDASGDLLTTNLSVDTPGDSPYITSAGGTTLPWSGTLSSSTSTATANVQVTQQRAWGWDYLWQPIATVTGDSLASIAESAVVGGGGGFSTSEATPSYQLGVSGTQSYVGVQYLTPTNYGNVGGIVEPQSWNFSSTPKVVHGWATGRAEPDLAADADPYSGYLLYEPSATQSGGAVLEGGWGGTSFVAPQLNGSAAVIDSSVGHRVGFWNPAIYADATSSNSPFTPLQQVGTNNDNIFFTGNPGALFNASTGLGVPNLSSIARDFQGRN